MEIGINEIEPGANQPRKNFRDAELAELAESIAQFGIIQPIVVKKEDGYYSIIAGERRWRAARLAKLSKIPVIVKDYGGAEAVEAALIENIQRADLNPIEEAACYARLMSEYGITQEALARRVGKSRTHISRSAGLLELDARVQAFVAEGRLTLGHVKAFMSVSDNDEQFRIAETVIEEGLSVRQTEALAEAARKEKAAPPKKSKPEAVYKHIEQELTGLFKTRVSIKGGARGKIEISYFSPEDLDRLLLLFKSGA
jgi:ParB family chromosome partitioning protein